MQTSNKVVTSHLRVIAWTEQVNFPQTGLDQYSFFSLTTYKVQIKHVTEYGLN